MKVTKTQEATLESQNRPEVSLREELTASAGWLLWEDLARHFARGVVVVVSPQLDLIEVASIMAMDDRARFSDWMGAGLVGAATDDHARVWAGEGSALRAIVVAPWILVQASGRIENAHKGLGG